MVKGVLRVQRKGTNKWLRSKDQKGILMINNYNKVGLQNIKKGQNI